MKKPTESELEVLQYLWENGPSTVKSINEYHSTKKEVGYTTTLKIMQIMLDKKLLTRTTEGRSHIYTAAIAQEDTQKNLLENFVDAAFGGKAMNMVMQTLGNHKASKDELEAIKRLIHKLEKE